MRVYPNKNNTMKSDIGYAKMFQFSLNNKRIMPHTGFQVSNVGKLFPIYILYCLNTSMLMIMLKTDWLQLIKSIELH